MPSTSPITPTIVSGADQQRALEQRQQHPIVSGAASDATTTPSGMSSGALNTVDAPGTAAGAGERIVAQPASDVMTEATSARLAQKAQDEAYIQPIGTASIPDLKATGYESSHVQVAAGGPPALPPRHPETAQAEQAAGGHTTAIGASSSPVHHHQTAKMSEPNKPNPLSSAYHAVHGGLESLRGAMLGAADAGGDALAGRKDGSAPSRSEQSDAVLRAGASEYQQGLQGFKNSSTDSAQTSTTAGTTATQANQATTL